MDRTPQILKSKRFISLQKEAVIDFHDLATPTLFLHINFILVQQQVDAAERHGQKPEKILSGTDANKRYRATFHTGAVELCY